MRKSRARLLATSRLAACGLAVAACSAPSSPARERSIFFASGADLQSINPLLTVHPLAKAVQKHLLLLPLAAYDSALRPVPRLAAWSWSEDRTALTFQLRDDVLWHDGRAVTAEDARWTLTMARDPAVAYPRRRDLASIVSIDTLGRHRLMLRFAGAQPMFPDVLTDLAILPAHAFAGLRAQDIRRAPFNTRPIGDGPFRFVEHRANDRWVFERAEEFPADLGVPPIDRFVVTVVNEPSTKLAALTSGELDFAGIAPAHAQFVREDPRLRVDEFPLLFVTGIFWNLRRAPFDEFVVRDALSRALDRGAIVEAYVYGFGVPAGGPVLPEHPWYDPTPVPAFDRDAAAHMLADAGWVVGADGVRARDGRRLSLELLTVGSGDLNLEQMVQAQLAEVGVEVRLRALELSTFLAVAQGSEREFDALMMGIQGDLALGYLGGLFGEPDNLQDYTGYRSQALRAAFARVDGARTVDALRAGWAAVQRAVTAGSAVTWLYHARGVQGVNARVRGSTPDIRGELANIAAWRVKARPQ